MSDIQPFPEQTKPNLELIQRCIEHGHEPVMTIIAHQQEIPLGLQFTGPQQRFKIYLCKRCGLLYWEEREAHQS